MKPIIKRNIPVFIIGAVTLVIFIVIILISQSRSSSLVPILTRVEKGEDQPTFRGTVTESVTPTIADKNPPPADEPTPSQLAEREDYIERTTLPQEKVDTKYGVLEITFTAEEGFSPKNTDAFLGQIVSFYNSTDKVIELTQKTPKFEDWKKERKYVSPGESLEFRLPKTHLWVYEEVDSGFAGSIYVRTATVFDK